jgi:hypothetical protein
LSGPHATAVGAKLPEAYRLYELTVGASSSVSSRSPASRPAMIDSPAGDRPYGPSPDMTGEPSAARNERWMWQEFPSRSFGLAMNVRAYPCLAAISFAPVL